MRIQWNIEQDIGMMTLNQPPSNILNMEFFRDLENLMTEIHSITNLKAIIISGTGRHFSSGSDIEELLRNSDQRTMMSNYKTCLMIEQMKIPVISAIRGVCLGSGFELALFTHFRICSADAVIGLPEASFNLMPGLGGITRVAALAGKSKSIELILRGLTFSAADAYAMGLADCVVPKKDIIQIAISFAKSLPVNYCQSDRQIICNKFLKPLNATI